VSATWQSNGAGRTAAEPARESLLDFAIEPVTAIGSSVVEMVTDQLPFFAEEAAVHDRDASFPFENFARLRHTGALAACVPLEFGGLGMGSLVDLVAVINRLGRADGSMAITTNMHLSTCWLVARAWRDAQATGDEPALRLYERLLEMLGRDELFVSLPDSERGTSARWPLTEARRVDGGWSLTGRKIFATNSPAATLFVVYVRLPSRAGPDGAGVAFIPRDTCGLEVSETWDALGMRASGSHDLVLDGCFVPDDMFLPTGDWGETGNFVLTYRVAGNIGLLGGFLGIAEDARDRAVHALKTRRKAPADEPLAERPSLQRTVAEMELGLAGARAILARTALAADDYFAAQATSACSLQDLRRLDREYQCAKWIVNRRAIDVVDLALTASGGSGYLNRDPLSRAYRDVRAGPFMQAYSPNEAFDYIGRLALDLEPPGDA
jgi:alkylation response protein AidB-like acyl-CoA dehydrogenase